MNETAQILLVTVVTILTIILSLVGVHIIFVLKELRNTLDKVNKILDHSEQVSSKFSHSLDSFPNMIVGVKTALSLLGLIKKEKEKS